MKFIADMGVSHRVAAWLRTQGHEVVHLRDEGLHRLPNGQIFELAKARSSIILTFDLDFGEIIALSGESAVSVVLFRVNNTTSPFVISRLQTALPSAAEDTRSVRLIDGRPRQVASSRRV